MSLLSQESHRALIARRGALAGGSVSVTPNSARGRSAGYRSAGLCDRAGCDCDLPDAASYTQLTLGDVAREIVGDPLRNTDPKARAARVRRRALRAVLLLLLGEFGDERLGCDVSVGVFDDRGDFVPVDFVRTDGVEVDAEPAREGSACGCRRLEESLWFGAHEFLLHTGRGGTPRARFGHRRCGHRGSSRVDACP